MSKWRKRSGEMEGFYLLCSIASTTITSSLLSLLLAVRSLAAPHRRPSDTDAAAAVRLYEGRVRHVRLRPVHNAFEYPVKYAFIDLDLAPQLSHFSADRAREVAATNGPVFLLTIPASVGYEQNPLSVYYCYDVGRGGEEEDGAPPPCLKTCIAEVTNTPWGERVTFLFNPSSDLVAKPLHVSPFMDMLGNWSIRADAPGENLFLAISVQHPTLGNYFTATLSAKRIHSLSSSHNLAIYFWLMPHKVAMWIYWQALKLWWENLPFLQHPMYINPMYRDDALGRDRELRCPLKARQEEDDDDGKRWCVWRDAKWPWSKGIMSPLSESRAQVLDKES